MWVLFFLQKKWPANYTFKRHIFRITTQNEDFKDTPNAQSGSISLTGNNQTVSATSEITYILNTNTLKFHLPNCEYAKKISNKNRQESSKPRESLISYGYSPCGQCNP